MHTFCDKGVLECVESTNPPNDAPLSSCSHYFTPHSSFCQKFWEVFVSIETIASIATVALTFKFESHNALKFGSFATTMSSFARRLSWKVLKAHIPLMTPLSHYFKVQCQAFAKSFGRHLYLTLSLNHTML